MASLAERVQDKLEIVHHYSYAKSSVTERDQAGEQRAAGSLFRQQAA